MRQSLSSRVLVALVLGFGASACGASSAEQQVRSAASADIGCNDAALEIVSDKPLEKTVTGCGQTITYVKRCGGKASTGNCWWMVYPAEHGTAAPKSAAAVDAVEGAGNSEVKADVSLGGAAPAVGVEAEGAASGDASAGADEDL